MTILFVALCALLTFVSYLAWRERRETLRDIAMWDEIMRRYNSGDYDTDERA